MLPDFQLTDHFSFHELTVTSNVQLQEQNRNVSPAELVKLKSLAEHCEQLRRVCSDLPLRVHSGYRCGPLNGVTVGASSTSQHPKCEAVDFDVIGLLNSEVFNRLLTAAERGEFEFGQLILERAQRDYGTSEWVHCSVIGTLEDAKVGQAMKMVAGVDGKQHYDLIAKLRFNREEN